jgi:hypothetical protein
MGNNQKSAKMALEKKDTRLFPGSPGAAIGRFGALALSFFFSLFLSFTRHLPGSVASFEPEPFRRRARSDAFGDSRTL